MTGLQTHARLAPHQVTVLRQLTCCDHHHFRDLDPAAQYPENRFPSRPFPDSWPHREGFNKFSRSR